MDLISYQPKFKSRLLAVWYASVRATHTFLDEKHLELIHLSLQKFPFEQLKVYCLFNQEDEMLGFIGCSEQNIEMLFVQPNHLGSGIGQRLLHFATDQLGCTKVDVNAQNDRALRFYKKNGFDVFAESPTDGMGLPYPILHLRLEKSNDAHLNTKAK